MTLHEHPQGETLSRQARIECLRALTPIPTAAGREHSVVTFIKNWVKRRPALRLIEDAAGNLAVAFAKPSKKSGKKSPPLFITAHLDHPAFVVERVVAPGVVELSFRGGVMDVFFENAPVVIHTAGGAIHATLTGKAPTSSAAGTHYLSEIGEAIDESDDAALEALTDSIKPGDIATWLLLPAEIDEQGVLHTPACDDLAAAAAALCAMDALLARRAAGAPIGDVRLLFTRAEEIGFIGAIAAVKLGTMPKGSRVLALENSRAFAESPVGGGPIVRVGDRLSTFTPWLTNACAERAEQIFGGPSQPTASQATAQSAPRRWQRKLMSGGACEASVFCHAGYDATCLCLPLGNYHNMPNLEEHQAGTYDAATLGPARAAREFIHTEDFHGLVDLLVALGEKLPDPSEQALGRKLAALYEEKAFVLGVVKDKRRVPVKKNSPRRDAGSHGVKREKKRRAGR